MQYSEQFSKMSIWESILMHNQWLLAKQNPNKLVIEVINMPKSLCNALNVIMIILFELWWLTIEYIWYWHFIFIHCIPCFEQNSFNIILKPLFILWPFVILRMFWIRLLNVFHPIFVNFYILYVKFHIFHVYSA